MLVYLGIGGQMPESNDLHLRIYKEWKQGVRKIAESYKACHAPHSGTSSPPPSPPSTKWSVKMCVVFGLRIS